MRPSDSVEISLDGSLMVRSGIFGSFYRCLGKMGRINNQISVVDDDDDDDDIVYDT